MAQLLRFPDIADPEETAGSAEGRQRFPDAIDPGADQRRRKMSAISGRRLAPERGAAMVVALLVTLVVFSLGVVWVGLGTHQAIGSGRESLREQARNGAEAGLNAAMGRLAGDPAWPGQGLTALPGRAEFEVSVLPVSADPADTRRYIVAKGYAPSRDAPRRVARRLEQQVDLVATDGFRYALFAAPGGVSGANRMTVNGDIYSATDITLSNNATVSGSVVSLGGVTTQNNSTIAGDVHATGNVVLNDANTTVLGDVRSGGSVTMTGRVKGSVQAAGTITGGTVDGARAEFSPPEPPRTQALPAFTWDLANYPSASAWAAPALFQAYWLANRGAFSGHHRVSCLSPCLTPVDLNLKWALTDDVTIVADGPITLSREITNAAGRPVTLTIVSLAPELPLLPPISMTNNLSLPDDVRVVFYAPSGPVHFKNLKHFSGAVYAASISLDQQFTLTFVPMAVPGFDWGPASATHFEVQAGAFREVPFS